MALGYFGDMCIDNRDTVMITELQASKSCYFYKQSAPLTAKAVNQLFRAVRQGQITPSNNHFCYVRQPHGDALWSAVCFQFDRKPAFLADTTKVFEKVSGYLLIVEYSDHIAVFKSQLDLTPAFVKAHLLRINSQDIDTGITTEGSVFGRVRLRHMTTSRLALRGKTLEGENLLNNVGLTSSSRFAPLGYSFRHDGEHFSTTPRTGRISQRSDRSGHEHLVDFATAIIDQITVNAGADSSAFLSTFARPLELSQLSALPTQFAVDTALLQESIFDDASVRFVKPNGAGYRELGRVEVEAIIQDLTYVLTVEQAGGKALLKHPVTGDEVGGIALNKTRIALRSLDVPSISDVSVESTQYVLGTDENRLPLRRFIDQNDAFIVLFDQPQYAYIDGSLYQDDSLTSGGATFLGYLFASEELAHVTGEKGTFSAAHTTFDDTSTFGAILGPIAAEDDVIVCDDLNEEWADFIGFRTDPASPRITFYHAKHGALSLGASPFHISVSQALKNLGNLALPEPKMAAKFGVWDRCYNNDRQRTRIQRVCRGTMAAVQAAVTQCRSAPHTMKRVAIVTSSLSKAAVAAEFDRMNVGGRVDPYFVQLYWLLSSYFAACAEVGAFGCVICQE